MLLDNENVTEMLTGRMEIRKMIDASKRPFAATPLEEMRHMVSLYTFMLEVNGVKPEIREQRIAGANIEAEEEVRRTSHAE